jgi:two-component system phosphate regulon sensor histidine kinase PhoR
VARRKFIWQLYPSYLLITLLSLLAVSTYGSRSLRNFFLEETTKDLEARAKLLRPEIERLFGNATLSEIDSLCKHLGQTADTRITVIGFNGRVIGDSEYKPSEMDNHRNRPEVVEVLEGGVGSSSRYSSTLHQNMMYVAVPLYEQGDLAGVLRTSTPVAVINHALGTIYARIAVGGLVIAILATWISWINARRITKPLTEIRQRAQRIAAGDLSGRLPTLGPEEVATLSEAMNQMASQLEDRIQTILRQRKEQKAVFSSISEGVLAVDAEGLLLSINKAAAKLFEVDRKQVRGRTIREVIDNEDIRLFVGKSLSTHGELEEEIILEEGGNIRYLQAHGRPLVDEMGDSLGAVVVLNDVTRLRRLEEARRDFVANVSHELRTPVTSIKGFIETLKDGALEDPDDAVRFVDIISRQADRLDAIIEDLLSLARIERDTESHEIQLLEEPLADTIRSAVVAVVPQAKAKNIKIETEVSHDLRAWINAPLLEQAIVNLIDNSVKYSEPDTTIQVSVAEETRDLVIHVRDEGVGIPAEHLPRLFERFYRVDKGRSRAVGGTGLGLAIVKHIVIAHGGSIQVNSTVGKGTDFSIHLPKIQQSSRSQQLHTT